MTPAQIRFLTLVRREVSRFLKIKKQTVGAPMLETFLYISVFGAALGSRIKELHGFDYVVFVIPGLIMMAWALNAFSNNSSSILQQKFQRAIDDQLSSPASPLELLLAFSLGGFLRGLVVATLTFAAASVLVDIPVDHVLVLLPGLFLVGFFFAQLGVLIGVRAEQFDDVSTAQTFILQPLIFLGGVFYSASLLPQPFETMTQFDPIYYMITLVRYGFLGYSETSVGLSLLFLSLATFALFAFNWRLFARAPVEGDYVTHVLPVMVLLGAGVGTCFPALMTISMSGATPEDAGLASGLVNTTLQVGGALGLAVLATLSATRTETLRDAGDSAATALNGGYHLAYLIGAALVLGSIAVAAILKGEPKPDEADARGAEPAYSDAG